MRKPEEKCRGPASKQLEFQNERREDRKRPIAVGVGGFQIERGHRCPARYTKTDPRGCGIVKCQSAEDMEKMLQASGKKK